MAKEKYFVLYRYDYAEGWAWIAYDTIEEVKSFIIEDVADNSYNYTIIKGKELGFEIQTTHDILFKEEI